MCRAFDVQHPGLGTSPSDSPEAAKTSRKEPRSRYRNRLHARVSVFRDKEADSLTGSFPGIRDGGGIRWKREEKRK